MHIRCGAASDSSTGDVDRGESRRGRCQADGQGHVRLHGRREVHFVCIRFHLRSGHKRSSDNRFGEFGYVLLRRPDKIRATRSGGFADVEMLFDGKMLTMLGKNAKLYAQIEIPGSIDHLIDELKDKYDRPLPAADLLMTDVYGQLMPDVTDIKDLGSGVIGGIECDHFAFRTKEVDWQIWIAQGDRPYPCRYVIKSVKVADGPQYSIQIRDWKTGDKVAADDFGFKNTIEAKKIDPKDIPEMDELPKHFKIGGAK